MTEDDATKLCQLVCDQYGKEAARLVPLSDGRAYAVMIRKACYFCWDFDDWHRYRTVEKQAQKRKRARHAEDDCYQGAIDYGMEHRLLAV